MSDMSAKVVETNNGFHVEGYEKIEYDFSFTENIFDKNNDGLAKQFTRLNRCLAVMDTNIFNVYGQQLKNYFDHHNIELKVHKTMIGEKAKSIETLLSIVDSMTEFGIIRKEPVLVVGGGLVTDVTGFACAAYRRNTNFIRIPTTVIGLIDASVSIKVGVNYGNYKNRLGAYHAPIHTFLDFGFLRTLPTAQIRNGFAELIKISSCAHLPTFDLLDKYAEKLIDTAFGHADGAEQEVKDASDKINRAGIHEMLKLETPNLHEIGLDRVIAYGHTWSPLHELTPTVPLRHGHAISIDMAYSATLANIQGLLSEDEMKRLHTLFSRCGLSMDHHDFNEEILDKATQAILKTRDGKLRAAVPNPLGSCAFINDIGKEELAAALRKHKELMKAYPRNGEGLEAYVDASDTGYTMNNISAEQKIQAGLSDELKACVINDDVAAGSQKGGLGATNVDGVTGGPDHAKANAAGAEVNGQPKDGLKNGVAGLVNGNGHINGNGHLNGTVNGNALKDCGCN